MTRTWLPISLPACPQPLFEHTTCSFVDPSYEAGSTIGIRLSSAGATGFGNCAAKNCTCTRLHVSAPCLRRNVGNHRRDTC